MRQKSLAQKKAFLDVLIKLFLKARCPPRIERLRRITPLPSVVR